VVGAVLRDIDHLSRSVRHFAIPLSDRTRCRRARNRRGHAGDQSEPAGAAVFAVGRSRAWVQALFLHCRTFPRAGGGTSSERAAVVGLLVPRFADAPAPRGRSVGEDRFRTTERLLSISSEVYTVATANFGRQVRCGRVVAQCRGEFTRRAMRGGATLLRKGTAAQGGRGAAHRRHSGRPRAPAFHAAGTNRAVRPPTRCCSARFAAVPRGRWRGGVGADGVRGCQPTAGMSRKDSPKTASPTRNSTTVKPMTSRTLSLAIASTGSSQNGWIMLATCSPAATDIDSLPR
jgi:hypothetical protein